jgi:hypothetical protein
VLFCTTDNDCTPLALKGRFGNTCGKGTAQLNYNTTNFDTYFWSFIQVSLFYKDFLILHIGRVDLDYDGASRYS